MNHPITPPLELVQQWATSSPIQHSDESWAYELFIAHQAANWGADQQLNADCEWVQSYAECGDSLLAAMRPKPPSLAEQATAELDEAVMRGDCITTTDAMPILRAALERLKELEQSND